ncbi:MAG: 4-(cytidine 5'-diphospho)-2-C-methyl-D-erythritol kinase [Cyclobacteriaceae bacterium]
MLSFPNAKINIGLYITEKREDGFHNLVSCFYPLPWNDALEIIPAETTSFKSYGIAIPGDNGNNLCLKAYHLVAKDYDLPPVEIILQKNIPIGAGLGGGSADAAFTVRGLNEQFNLWLAADQMEDYVRHIGSDCAFFIKNEAVLAVGKGDEFLPLDLTIDAKYLVLINPGIHISTREAYSGVAPKQPEIDLQEVLQQPIENWKGKVKNDFENHLFVAYPELAEIKEMLYAKGAAYASMSGSGSTMYGFFKTKPEISSLPSHFLVKIVELTS